MAVSLGAGGMSDGKAEAEAQLLCPTCRAAGPRSQWRTVLRWLECAGPGGGVVRVVRHRLCGALAFIVLVSAAGSLAPPRRPG